MSRSNLLRLSLLSLALLLPGPGFPASAAAPPGQPAGAARAVPAAPREKTDAEKQKQTVADMRNLGTALFSWLTDQVDTTAGQQAHPGDPGAAPAGPKTHHRVPAAGQPPKSDAQGAKPDKAFDVESSPLISTLDLEDLLVPKYLAEIPEVDGWGNPYEVRLNTDDLMAKTVMSIRSPGRDGRYSADVYELAGFDPTDYDQDVVWADGFFVRWPQKR
ncbi:MAG TPA: hypothetical protein VIA62_25060 [Thermoanaerobaculia bacterium]|jgi:hypothetical protein|nr:hypothetical protein [Thermoanaerobaculia bacterium]